MGLGVDDDLIEIEHRVRREEQVEILQRLGQEVVAQRPHAEARFFQAAGPLDPLEYSERHAFTDNGDFAIAGEH
jgi:hypothetical protein